MVSGVKEHVYDTDRALPSPAEQITWSYNTTSKIAGNLKSCSKCRCSLFLDSDVLILLRRSNFTQNKMKSTIAAELKIQGNPTESKALHCSQLPEVILLDN